jgi:hypothetical protein
MESQAMKLVTGIVISGDWLPVVWRYAAQELEKDKVAG